MFFWITFYTNCCSIQHLQVVAMDHFSANAASCHTYFWKFSEGHGHSLTIVQESFIEWPKIAKLLFSCLKHLLVEEFIFYVILSNNVRGVHLGSRLVGFHQLTVQKKIIFSVLFLKCCCQVNKRLYHYFIIFLYLLCSDDQFFLFWRSK